MVNIIWSYVVSIFCPVPTPDCALARDAFPYEPLFPSYDKTACCEYVECDGDGFITSISLVDLTDPLTCKLSMPDFSSLTKLTKLELRNSQIGGDMPTCLPPALAWLDLSKNSISGPIPPLPETLTFASFSNNQLNGNLPNLPENLIVFSAENNTIKDQVSSLPDSLRVFNMSGNLLMGPIPSPLPTQLSSLRLANNNMNGVIPPFPESLILPNYDLNGNCFENAWSFGVVNQGSCSYTSTTTTTSTTSTSTMKTTSSSTTSDTTTSSSSSTTTEATTTTSSTSSTETTSSSSTTTTEATTTTSNTSSSTTSTSQITTTTSSTSSTETTSSSTTSTSKHTTTTSNTLSTETTSSSTTSTSKMTTTTSNTSSTERTSSTTTSNSKEATTTSTSKQTTTMSDTSSTKTSSSTSTTSTKGTTSSTTVETSTSSTSATITKVNTTTTSTTTKFTINLTTSTSTSSTTKSTATALSTTSTTTSSTAKSTTTTTTVFTPPITPPFNASDVAASIAAGEIPTDKLLVPVPDSARQKIVDAFSSLISGTSFTFDSTLLTQSLGQLVSSLQPGVTFSFVAASLPATTETGRNGAVFLLSFDQYTISKVSAFSPLNDVLSSNTQSALEVFLPLNATITSTWVGMQVSPDSKNLVVGINSGHRSLAFFSMDVSSRVGGRKKRDVGVTAVSGGVPLVVGGVVVTSSAGGQTVLTTATVFQSLVASGTSNGGTGTVNSVGPITSASVSRPILASTIADNTAPIGTSVPTASAGPVIVSESVGSGTSSVSVVRGTFSVPVAPGTTNVPIAPGTVALVTVVPNPGFSTNATATSTTTTMIVTSMRNSIPTSVPNRPKVNGTIALTDQDFVNNATALVQNMVPPCTDTCPSLIPNFNLFQRNASVDTLNATCQEVTPTILKAYSDCVDSKLACQKGLNQTNTFTALLADLCQRFIQPSPIVTVSARNRTVTFSFNIPANLNIIEFDFSITDRYGNTLAGTPFSQFNSRRRDLKVFNSTSFTFPDCDPVTVNMKYGVCDGTLLIDNQCDGTVTGHLKTQVLDPTKIPDSGFDEATCGSSKVTKTATTSPLPLNNGLEPPKTRTSSLSGGQLNVGDLTKTTRLMRVTEAEGQINLDRITHLEHHHWRTRTSSSSATVTDAGFVTLNSDAIVPTANTKSPFDDDDDGDDDSEIRPIRSYSARASSSVPTPSSSPTTSTSGQTDVAQPLQPAGNNPLPGVGPNVPSYPNPTISVSGGGNAIVPSTPADTTKPSTAMRVGISHFIFGLLIIL